MLFSIEKKRQKIDSLKTNRSKAINKKKDRNKIKVKNKKKRQKKTSLFTKISNIPAPTMRV